MEKSLTNCRSKYQQHNETNITIVVTTLAIVIIARARIHSANELAGLPKSPWDSRRHGKT